MVGILFRKRGNQADRHHIEEDVETQREDDRLQAKERALGQVLSSPSSEGATPVPGLIILIFKKNNFKGLVALPYCVGVSAVQQSKSVISTIHISTHF